LLPVSIIPAAVRPGLSRALMASVPHFGIVLKWDQWEALAERLRSFGTQFVIEPYIRFKGQTGEQATMFLFDPCGNALEFKAFKDISQLFAK
jgi:extradiol dioxygenase family protein